MDCSTPGLPVLHHLPEPAQTHVHWVGFAEWPGRRWQSAPKLVDKLATSGAAGDAADKLTHTVLHGVPATPLLTVLLLTHQEDGAPLSLPRFFRRKKSAHQLVSSALNTRLDTRQVYKEICKLSG